MQKSGLHSNGLKSESAFLQDSQMTEVGEGLLWKPTAFHGDFLSIMSQHSIQTLYDLNAY